MNTTFLLTGTLDSEDDVSYQHKFKSSDFVNPTLEKGMLQSRHCIHLRSGKAFSFPTMIFISLIKGHVIDEGYRGVQPTKIDFVHFDIFNSLIFFLPKMSLTYRYFCFTSSYMKAVL